MVIKEDGTKWACQSCLKGHRVSGCTHTDRPLQFVPKKGRPVTQCQHCRVERKKRSAHVKCDCGEKAHSKEKCIHLRNAEAAAALEQAKELVPVPESDAEHSDGHVCCCSHGESCTCFTAKHTAEQLLDQQATIRAKPRLTATQSESVLTVFANGHHKPVHRHNTTAHDANQPYRIHKPHHPHPSHHPIHGLHVAARRSVDSLAPSEKASKLDVDWAQQMVMAPQASTQTPPSSTADTTTTFDAYVMPATTMAASGADNYFTVQPDMQFKEEATEVAYPQSALSEASADFDWDAFDWNTLSMSNQQPALTYASSNAISETGDHTPPDEGVLGFNLQRVNGAVNEITVPAAPVPRPVANLARQENSTNRWSLPPSFLLDGSGNDLATSMGYAKAVASVSANAFPAFDLAMSASSEGQQQMPMQNPQLFMDNDKLTASPLEQWQGTADELFMQYASQVQNNPAPSMNNFGYVSESDASETVFNPGQANDFSFFGTPESLDFTQDFAQNTMTESAWSNQ